MPDQQVQEWMEKMRQFLRFDKMSPSVRKILVSVVGGAIFIAGIIMMVTPGPAFVLIPMGLLLLASEFKWAEQAAQKLLDWFNRVRRKWRQKRGKA
jgi:putative transmembrane protein PGPGW